MDKINSTFSAGRSWAPFQHVSALEVFLPGISRALGGLSAVLAGDLNMFAYIACALGMIGFVQTYINRLLKMLKPHFAMTIHISQTDEAYEMLFAWLKRRGLDGSAGVCTVGVSKKGQPGIVTRHSKKALEYKPWRTSFKFWYRGSMISYKNQSVEKGPNRVTEEQTTLSCLGWSNKILKQLMQECRKEYLEQVSGKTSIFESNGSSWKKLKDKDVRPLSTVIIDHERKQQFLNDIQGFLSEETRLWYTQRALPYRRGYLLYGPPGTGKSSLSLAIAGQLDLDVYVINVPDTSNTILKNLFETLPETCIVLLEDIDAVGVSRTSDPENAEDVAPVRPGRRTRGSVTLSGLLNTLDGVTSQDGRIVVMTTNHRENLDEALIRPGRVDMQIELPVADYKVTTDLFIFLLAPVNQESGDEDGSFVGKEKDAMEAKAAKFASMVPPATFSQAEIISFLLMHKTDADAALAQCEQWVEQKIEEKRLAAEIKESKAKLLASKVSG
ncbi:unnamed protein product [Clonostachys rosea]|uniref:AAA+ ATPase domain-containing protein n=1 Tax=Bionectria ochroleuca TaxID=29856 RepID=A0ABY6UPH9_BIOOC|nr:unnamed protein product [Clonostachys rosea]